MTLIPLDAGKHLSPYVAACEKTLSDAGLKVMLHANGTNIEGEWDEVMAAVKKCHENVLGMGAPRIFTVLKLGTRVDKKQTMEDKMASVKEKLEKL
jgi:uncharacterized protein (TIGR00106 family)